jgi:hypothetical protein
MPEAMPVVAPFKGGVLVPSSDVILAAMPIDGNGDLVVAGTWPTGIPAGVPLWMQYWVRDPSDPEGFAASNGITGTTLP